MNMRKVGIIGVGHVGAHVALSLAMQGICDEIQLCDIDEEKIVYCRNYMYYYHNMYGRSITLSKYLCYRKI